MYQRNTPACELPSIVKLLDKNGTKFVATDPVSGYSNPNFMYCNCPHCPDENLSVKINISRNVYHCRACGAGGTSISYIRWTKAMTFREAAAYLEEETFGEFAEPFNEEKSDEKTTN